MEASTTAEFNPQVELEMLLCYAEAASQPWIVAKAKDERDDGMNREFRNNRAALLLPIHTILEDMVSLGYVEPAVVDLDKYVLPERKFAAPAIVIRPLR